MEATLTFLGTGTSMGVPTLGCDCDVCASAVAAKVRASCSGTCCVAASASATVFIIEGPSAATFRSMATSTSRVVFTRVA